jgi:hypothetical protein
MKGVISMKNFVMIAVALFGCTFAYGADEPTPAEKSVLVPATSAQVTTSDTNCNNCVGIVECRKCRLYNVEETCDESCRNRLFGGYVKKQTVRKVYRPVR